MANSERKKKPSSAADDTAQFEGAITQVNRARAQTEKTPDVVVAREGGDRPRRRRPPRRAPQQRDNHRQNHPEHDVLIFPRANKVKTEGEFIRVPAAPGDGAVPPEAPPALGTSERAAQKGPKGERVPPYGAKSEAWNLLDVGARRAISAARPDLRTEQGRNRDGEESATGPGFSILPVKPEPAAASFITCYLINVENLAGRNYWTVEEWSDPKQEVDFATPRHPAEFEALIAGPWGKVYRLKVVEHEKWPSRPICMKVGDATIAELESIDLRNEPQIWAQLRNGTVAGRTWFKNRKKVLPLVNITALGDELPFQEKKES